jgi:hypothetical protein
MVPIKRFYLISTGWLVWKKPSRSAKLLAKFSQAERGSSYDMLAAAEKTHRRELRRKYLEHALDEAQHARMFKNRALELGVSRELKALIDIGYLTDHGIVAGETLFERMGELKFLAFVHIAEKHAVEHFKIFRDYRFPDDTTIRILDQISKDEIFHMTYSLKELEKYAKHGKEQEKEVKRIFFSVRLQRCKESWLRFGHNIGDVMTTFWMLMLYFFIVPPFSIFAKPESTGWKKIGNKNKKGHLRQF